MDRQSHTVTGWHGSGRPAHAVRPWPQPSRLLAGAVGTVLFAAAGLGLALGLASCLHSAGPSRSTPGSASLITVTPALDTAAPSP